MVVQPGKLIRLRSVITENLRIQKSGVDAPEYIDVGNALVDICARQNHAVFARRGCGKTLLLHDSNRHLDPSIKSVYLNCEDFKHHSFPNVLIEILDALFAELERHLTGWFGRKRKSRQLIQGIRTQLAEMRVSADRQEEAVQKTASAETTSSASNSIGLAAKGAEAKRSKSFGDKTTEETKRTFKVLSDKSRDLDMRLPSLRACLEISV